MKTFSGIYEADKAISEWRIVGDARIDGQGLVENDLDYILQAYQRWGVDCVQHLRGDFAFAIWDSREQCLFCVRDQMGLKPFCYARLPEGFVFANSIAALQANHAIPNDLDETWLGDYFTFGYPQDADSSVYKAIRRLPPAHWLKISSDKFEIQRYWDLAPSTAGKKPVEEYRELFTNAVQDRLRGANRAAVMMSGGTDSTAVAAVAKQFVDLKAFVIVYKALMPEDEEGAYAKLVGERHNFPVETILGDNYALYAGAKVLNGLASEPNDYPAAALWDDFMQACISYSPVVLSGNGGDPIFAPNNYYLRLMQAKRWGQLLQSLLRFQQQHGSLSRSNIRGQFRAYMGQKTTPDWFPPLPEWLNPDFVRRSALRERMAAQYENAVETIWRYGLAYYKTRLSMWQTIFEYDTWVRHPFFDINLLAFTLGLPPELRKSKSLHREAMRGILPEAVRLRPKTPMARDTFAELYPQSEKVLLRPLALASEYVNVEQFQASMRQFIASYPKNKDQSACSTAPISLEFWLENRFL